MVLRRLGNKAKEAKKIIPHFPEHEFYFEAFFGAGGMYFNKPRAKHNYLNDYDSEVFNLWMVLDKRKDELYEYIYNLPYSTELFAYWKENKETDDIKKAGRFLYLSNFALFGARGSMKMASTNAQNILLANILNFKGVRRAKFTNKDFRLFFTSFSIEDKAQNVLAYSDPPYLETKNNYGTPTWTREDVIDLFRIPNELGFKHAISEFDHPDIMAIADEFGYNKIEIGERKNINNRRTEMLYTNYASTQLRMF